MYFRITIPSLQDGKKDEAISFVKEKVMPGFDGTPGLLTMMAAITGENSGVNLSAYESKEAAEAVEEKIQGVLSEAAGMMAAPPVIYKGDAVYGKVYQTMAKESTRPSYFSSEVIIIIHFLSFGKRLQVPCLLYTSPSPRDRG